MKEMNSWSRILKRCWQSFDDAVVAFGQLLISDDNNSSSDSHDHQASDEQSNGGECADQQRTRRDSFLGNDFVILSKKYKRKSLKDQLDEWLAASTDETVGSEQYQVQMVRIPHSLDPTNRFRSDVNDNPRQDSLGYASESKSHEHTIAPSHSLASETDHILCQMAGLDLEAIDQHNSQVDQQRRKAYNTHNAEVIQANARHSYKERY